MLKLTVAALVVGVLATSALGGNGDKYTNRIVNSDKRAYAEGQCDKINDSDLRWMCKGQCWKINDKDTRNMCLSQEKDHK